MPIVARPASTPGAACSFILPISTPAPPGFCAGAEASTSTDIIRMQFSAGFALENSRVSQRKSFPMTQIDLAATPQATAFAELLESAATPHELAVYRGVLTPRELDAPDAESAALARGAAGHDLGWLRRVAVRGEDRFRWLSGMVTNMVND